MLKGFAFTALAVLALAFSAKAWAESQKVALVIGNAGYAQLNPLNNTVNDARAMAQALADIGFDAQLVMDADEGDLRKAVRRFTTDSAGKSLAVVFYAGHGVQVDGENYILPTDFELPKAESDIKISGLKIDDILAAMQSRVRVVFLDACRDSPAIAKRLSGTNRSAAGAQQGLAPVKTADVAGEAGIFIAFATAAGRVAQDGDGRHSPFTQALLDNIKSPVSIDDMFSLVTKQVSASTKNTQRPYKYASLDSIVCLTEACGSNAPASNQRASSAVVSTGANTIDPNDTAWLLMGVSTRDRGRYYFAPESIKKLGEYLTLETQTVSADGAVATANSLAFDCKRKAAYVYGGANLKNGRKVAGTEFLSAPGTAQLTPFDKGSLFEGLSLFACGHVPVKAETAQEVVFSDDWMPITLDSHAIKWSVLPGSIKKAGDEVLVVIKHEIPANLEKLADSQIEGIGDVFTNTYAVKVLKSSVNCGSGEMRNYSTEAWTREKVMTGKYAVMPKDVIPTKLNPNKVGADVANYVCAKAGKQLVIP